MTDDTREAKRDASDGKGTREWENDWVTARHVNGYFGAKSQINNNIKRAGRFHEGSARQVVPLLGWLWFGWHHGWQWL